MPGSSSTSCPLLIHQSIATPKAGAGDRAVIMEEDGTVLLQGKLVVSPLLLRRAHV